MKKSLFKKKLNKYYIKMSKQELSELKEKSEKNSINFQEIIKIEEEENDYEIKFTLQNKNIIKAKKMIVFNLLILHMTKYSKLFLEKAMYIIKKMETIDY